MTETKYLFLDIDNTFYSGKSGQVPATAMEAVRLARANGSKVFLCTGRSRAEAMKYLDLDVDGFIFSSGSYCVAGNTVIYDHPISTELVNEIMGLIRRFEMGVLLGGLNHAYLDQKCYEDVKNYFSKPETDEETKRKDMRENGMFEMEQRDPEDPVYKMGASVSHGISFEPLREVLPHPFRLIQTLSSPEGDFGDISDGSIMKSDGIRRVLDWYGADFKDAVGIGDSENDLDMIQACGLGIAMGNGSDAVKQAANWVTSDIDDDGLLHAFEYAGVI